MSQPKEKEKNMSGRIFSLVRIILPVLIIVILLFIQLLVAFQNNKLLKQITKEQNTMEENKNIYEEEISLEDVLELLLKQISGINEENAAVRRAVNGLYAGKRDEKIVSMLSEKFINDYTEKGLGYFFDADYKNAQNAFNMALLYQNNNTALSFFKTYCSYLNFNANSFNEDEISELLLNIRELKEKDFTETEIIYFSVSEMEKILGEMEFNLNLFNTERVSNEKE